MLPEAALADWSSYLGQPRSRRQHSISLSSNCAILHYTLAHLVYFCKFAIFDDYTCFFTQRILDSTASRIVLESLLLANPPCRLTLQTCLDEGKSKRPPSHCRMTEYLLAAMALFAEIARNEKQFHLRGANQGRISSSSGQI